jgi:thiamine kinase-like enzyme
VGESLAREVLSSPVVVLEKLDGLNVGLDFSPSRRLRFFSRALGEVRPAQMARELWPLVDWAYLHLVELWSLLGTRRTLFGEWLAGGRYPKQPDDFVALGLREGNRFVAFERARSELTRHGFAVPPELARVVPGTTQHLEKLSRHSVWGGRAEGVVLEYEGQWFKWVRPEFEAPVRLPLDRLGVAQGERRATSRRAHRATVTKRFSELELAILKRGVGPRVVEVQDSKLVLEHVGTGQWPKRASVELAKSLGRALKKLHRLGGVVAPSLELSPAAHGRTASRRLSVLLAPQEKALERGPTVLCHGDLKPSNVRTEKSTAHLIDFERAFYAERAWELGAAADRLSMPRNTLLSFWKSVGVRSGDEVARAALYRLAWTLLLTGKRTGSSSAKRIAASLRQRARRMKRFL